MNALAAAIERGDLQLQLPQALILHGGETLQCEQLLRLMPGKRGVFKARYREQPVLAKIFLAGAARQQARELAGYERLCAAQQPTPKLIHTVDFDGGSALLFEFLNDAQPLFREDTAPSARELAHLLDRLQSMYTAGVYHDDLHWGNFLQRGDTAFVIDAGAVLGNPPQALNSAQVTDNLGLLIAQFQRRHQAAVRAAVLTHALSAQFQLTGDALLASAEQHWQHRKQTLLQKCFRSTTATCFASAFDRVYAFRRSYAGSDLEAFLRDPDRVMARAQALKLGNSATVAKLTMDGRIVVIKRYNIKNIGHWLRRCWRPSRAWTSWRNAHWLELLGLHTPAPIALLEMRCGPLRRRAYYVCEYSAGTALGMALNQREPSAQEFTELEQYFTVAAQEQLIHGDMKATNFFLQQENLFVLDLDSLREESKRRWKTAYMRDFARFKRNWPDNKDWLDRLQRLVDNETS